MIDTVVLRLIGDEFVITTPSAFGPPKMLLGGGESRFQNSTKQEQRTNVTNPGLTWTRRLGRLPELRLEVSVPKMFYGDNLSEVEEADLPEAVEKLSGRLASMGVAASPEALVAARVSKLHVSKNVVLSAGMTVSSVLWALWRTRTSARRDGRDTHWDNGGLALRIRTTERELILYDKLADLKKATWSPMRSVDPPSGALPLGDAADSLAGAVLRLEVRLNRPRTVESALRQVGMPIQSPRLGDVFSEEVSKAILLHELKLFGEETLAAQPNATPSEMLDSLLADGFKLDFALKAVSLALVERDLTPIGLRNRLRERGVPDRHWYELKRFRRLPSSARTGSKGAVDLLRRSVAEFKPIRSTPSASKPVPPREYYSDTFAGFSVIPDSHQPEEHLVSESPFVPPS